MSSYSEGLVVAATVAHNEQIFTLWRQADVGVPDVWDLLALWAHTLSARLGLEVRGASQT